MPPKKKDEKNEAINRINEKLSAIESQIDSTHKGLEKTFCEKFGEIEDKNDLKYHDLSTELTDKYKELEYKFDGMV